MKKTLLAICSMILFNLTIYSQCIDYGHFISSSSFNCGNSTGDICFTTTGDITNPFLECFEYVVDIEFPTGDFIYTNLGPDFTVFKRMFLVPLFLEEHLSLIQTS